MRDSRAFVIAEDKVEEFLNEKPDRLDNVNKLMEKYNKHHKEKRNNMKQYRIKSILHSGRKGERNTPRTDGRYPLRIGRIVELDTKDLKEGYSLILNYVTDENGNDYRGYYLQCSVIKDWDYVYDNVVRVETNNTIYEFEEV